MLKAPENFVSVKIAKAVGINISKREMSFKSQVKKRMPRQKRRRKMLNTKRFVNWYITGTEGVKFVLLGPAIRIPVDGGAWGASGKGARTPESVLVRNHTHFPGKLACRGKLSKMHPSTALRSRTPSALMGRWGSVLCNNCVRRCYVAMGLLRCWCIGGGGRPWRSHVWARAGQMASLRRVAGSAVLELGGLCPLRGGGK